MCKAISTRFYRNGQIKLLLPTTIFIAVGQQFFFPLEANGKKFVNFKILYCASPFSQL
jgi:hypothetical protein